jgi:type II secretory pathway component PulJ
MEAFIDVLTIDVVVAFALLVVVAALLVRELVAFANGNRDAEDVEELQDRIVEFAEVAEDLQEVIETATEENGNDENDGNGENNRDDE